VETPGCELDRNHGGIGATATNTSPCRGNLGDRYRKGTHQSAFIASFRCWRGRIVCDPFFVVGSSTHIQSRQNYGQYSSTWHASECSYII
jgi:hypothetical protein